VQRERERGGASEGERQTEPFLISCTSHLKSDIKNKSLNYYTVSIGFCASSPVLGTRDGLYTSTLVFTHFNVTNTMQSRCSLFCFSERQVQDRLLNNANRGYKAILNP
jgi:hypothetical protein